MTQWTSWSFSLRHSSSFGIYASALPHLSLTSLCCMTDYSLCSPRWPGLQLQVNFFLFSTLPQLQSLQGQLDIEVSWFSFPPWPCFQVQIPDNYLYWYNVWKKKKVKVSRVRLFATPWTVVLQAPLSMGFSQQEYRSGLPFPSPGDLPDSGIKLGYSTLPRCVCFCCTISESAICAHICPLFWISFPFRSPQSIW